MATIRCTEPAPDASTARTICIARSSSRRTSDLRRRRGRTSSACCAASIRRLAAALPERFCYVSSVYVRPATGARACCARCWPRRNMVRRARHREMRLTTRATSVGAHAWSRSGSRSWNRSRALAPLRRRRAAPDAGHHDLAHVRIGRFGGRRARREPRSAGRCSTTAMIDADRRALGTEPGRSDGAGRARAVDGGAAGIGAFAGIAGDHAASCRRARSRRRRSASWPSRGA